MLGAYAKWEKNTTAQEEEERKKRAREHDGINDGAEFAGSKGLEWGIN